MVFTSGYSGHKRGGLGGYWADEVAKANCPNHILHLLQQQLRNTHIECAVFKEQVHVWLCSDSVPHVQGAYRELRSDTWMYM